MPQAGDTIRALDFPPSAWAEEAANISVVSDTFTTAGGPLCGLTFVAPISRSGTIHIGLFGDSDNATPVGAMVSVTVRTGGVIGAGTLHQPAGIAYSVTKGEAGEPDAAGGVAVDVTGLVPGATYNAVLEHQRAGGAGTGSIFHRTIKWVPDVSR